MVNCNKVENDNDKVDYIKKDKYRPRRRHRDKYRKYSVSR